MIAHDKIKVTSPFPHPFPPFPLIDYIILFICIIMTSQLLGCTENKKIDNFNDYMKEITAEEPKVAYYPFEGTQVYEASLKYMPSSSEEIQSLVKIILNEKQRYSYTVRSNCYSCILHAGNQNLFNEMAKLIWDNLDEEFIYEIVKNNFWVFQANRKEYNSLKDKGIQKKLEWIKKSKPLTHFFIDFLIRNYNSDKEKESSQSG